MSGEAPDERAREVSSATGGLVSGEAPDERVDLRLLPVAAGLWGGALLGLHLSSRDALLGCLVPVVIAAVTWRRWLTRRHRVAAAVAVLCLVVGVVAGASRAVHVRDGPVTQLAEEEAHVTVEGVIVSDPQLRSSDRGGGQNGPGSKFVLVRLRVDEVAGRGLTHEVRVPVLAVTGDRSWMELLPGQRLRVSGGVSPADGDVAAFLNIRGAAELLGEPGMIARLSEPLRAGLRDAVRVVPGEHRGLIPGMVVGDESLMSDELREDMRATSLTHLTAVSGTHVGIVLLTVLGLARLVGIRGYALSAVALLSLVGFVLLVRPEPSVLRAAVMGTLAVLGLVVAGRRRALPALAAAVGVLVLVDPWLARSVGFALSVSATAGILVLVPAWQRSMAWLPRPVALAVAVPLAAQVACTPVLLATFGQFSVASVPANMLVAVVVAPAMVLGLAAAVTSLLFPALAAALAWLAGLPSWWIAAVARWFAAQPGAEFGWPEGTAGVLAGVALTAGAVVVLPVMLRRPLVSVVAATVFVFVLLRAVPTPGWPPAGWSVVACDVGQGDATVLRAGPRSAVVVDAGPDPLLVRRCLDSLGVVDVPLLVLTHFHADHVNGVPGVLAGRRVARAMVSPLREPVESAEAVDGWLEDARVPVDAAQAGRQWVVGELLSLEVLWPRGITTSSEESAANNASVVLAAEVDGAEVLLTGDLEPTAQQALLEAEPGLNAQVLKVAHHGSANQYPQLLTSVGAELALISVGENSHGHPSGEVIDLLREAGAEVRRTDQDGTLAVVSRDGDLSVGAR